MASLLHAQAPDTLRGRTAAQGLSIPYAVLSRTDSTDSLAPLILFFHGAGERGTENKQHLVVGLPYLVRALDSLHITRYYIYAPQCPLGRRWVESDWTLPSHSMAPQPGDALAAALHGIDSLAPHLRIDSSRVYVTGLSMGGFATWELCQRYPGRITAAMPICGGGDTAYAAQAAKVPVWAFHGAKDKLVKPSRTKDMVAALQRHGAQPMLTIFPNIGHLCWDYAYLERQAVAWLMQQRRP